MKRFLKIISLGILIMSTVLIVTPAKSQVTSMKSQWSLTEDTVTTTAAKYLTSNAILGFKKVVEIVFDATEIGTPTTGGAVTLEGSLDNSTWVTISEATSFTLTDVASQVSRWKLTDVGFIYFRVKWLATGSPNIKIHAKYNARVAPQNNN
jgi:hypothetical protein